MQEPSRSQTAPGSIGRLLLQLAGGAVIISLTGLSMWAVGAIQLETHPEDSLLRYWYLAVFLALEVWVCLGLLLSAERLRQGRWLASVIAFSIWCLATGLSALQESRFHTFFDSRIEAAAAPVQLEYAVLTSRIAELEAGLAAQSTPSRNVAAIEVELDGYEARRDAANFPTKITALRAELNAAEGYALLTSELADARTQLIALSGTAAENADARKVGQAIALPGITLPPSVSVWLLIGTMIAIKALGPWLLFGTHARKPIPPPVLNSEPDVLPAPPEPEPKLEPDWEMIERTDRQGRVKRVKVPRAAMA